MSSNEPGDFEKRAAQLLRDGADELDGATRARLARARATALVPAARHRNWFDFRYLAPAGVVAAAVLATVLYIGRGESSVNDSSGAALYDMELLADTDALDIAEETDLDFIEWAAAQGEQGGG